MPEQVPSLTTLPEGARLGRYMLLGALGQGPVLDVYAAKLFGEHGFQKDVAFKVPNATTARDAASLEAFVERAKRTMTLSHANILGTIDLGREPVELASKSALASELQALPVTFLVTERARGASLASIVARSAERGMTLPLGAIFRLGAELAKALDHAHRRPTPIIHGAVRESKVFVTPEGQLKIGDFGLEIFPRGEHEPSPATDLVALSALLTRLIRVSSDPASEAARAALEALQNGAVAEAASAHDRLLELSFAVSPERDGRAVERLLACFAEPASEAPMLSEVVASLEREPAERAPLPDEPSDRRWSASGRFVGRADELAAIAVALGKTLSGGAERRVVSGPAGVGKTRLLRELARRVPTDRVRTVFVQCARSLAHVPLGAIALAVRALASLPETGALDADDVVPSLTALGRESAEVASLARILGVPYESDCRALPAHDALLGLVAGVSRGLPMLIVFDDAHELDPASESVLAALIESDRARGVPLLVTLVLRSDEHPSASDGPPIHVGELDDDAVAQLLANRLGARIIPPDLFELVVSRAGGHPLFIETLVKDLVASAFVEVRGGVAQLVSGPLPVLAKNLSEAARSKVCGLPPELQRALSALAVIHEGADIELLAAALGLAEPETERTVSLLAELGLLRRGPRGEAFMAGVYRDAALALAEPLEQTETHLRAARFLRTERLGAEAATQLVFAAEHFGAAGANREAAAAFCEAARAFEGLGAADAAAGLFARALPALDSADEAARSLEALTRLAEHANLASLEIEEGLGNALTLSDRILDKDARIALRSRLAVALARHRALELADVLLDQAEAMSAPVLAAVVVTARLAVAARAKDPLRARDALDLFSKEVAAAGTPVIESWLDAIDVALLSGATAQARSLLSIVPESDATLAERARVLGCYARLAQTDGDPAAAAELFDKAIALARLDPSSGEEAKACLESAALALDSKTPAQSRAFSRLTDALEVARRVGDAASAELALSELEALEKGPLARAAIELRAERAEAQGRRYDSLRLTMVVAKRLYGRDAPALEALAVRAESAGLGGLAQLARGAKEPIVC